MNTTATNMSDPAVTARADIEHGEAFATAELPATPERVFRALTSDEICQWWVRAGVFDTRHWAGDVKVGGRWDADGMGGAGPYRLEGEFVEIDAPTRLVHTWHIPGSPGEPGRVTYQLDAVPDGTRVTLHHSGLTLAQVCTNTAIGWETSFRRLAELLEAEQVV